MIEPKKVFKELSRTPPVFEDRIGKVYRFDRNERTTPFPEAHLAKIVRSITPDEMIAYPQLEPFYHQLSQWLHVKREEVLLTSGSDTGIKAIYEVYVQQGDEVVILSPTYGMYSVYCRMYGAVAKEIGYNEDLSLPVERILQAIGQGTKLVAIANPNHTGTVLSQSDLLKIIEAARNANALVLIDEAYYHFYEGTMISFINKWDNLIIARTFSKAFGIAPLRVGYLIANQELISQLFKVKLTHEITAFAARTGCYLLNNLEILEDYVQDVNQGKDVLYKRLPQIDFEVLQSEGNFVYFKMPSNIDGKKLVSDLEEKKIYIKGPFSKTPFRGHYRVTTGTEEQMQMFCDAIEDILSRTLAIPKRGEV